MSSDESNITTWDKTFSQKYISYNDYSGRAYHPATFHICSAIPLTSHIWKEKDYNESVFARTKIGFKNAFQTRKIDLLLNESKHGLKYDVVDSKTGRYIFMMSNRAFNDIRFSIKKSCKLPARLYGLYMFGAVSQDIDSYMHDLKVMISMWTQKNICDRNTFFKATNSWNN